jgi:hypothetical protein
MRAIPALLDALDHEDPERAAAGLSALDALLREVADVVASSPDRVIALRTITQPLPLIAARMPAYALPIV